MGLAAATAHCSKSWQRDNEPTFTLGQLTALALKLSVTKNVLNTLKYELLSNQKNTIERIISK